MDTAQNNLINRQQDLLNQLQAKKQKFKNAPTKQAKINLLREIKEIKKEIIRNKKILANTQNIKKCYKTEAQKLMQNPELEVKLSRKNSHS